jgi:c-di-GMP-binding flagellar brake protein YcgR
MVKPRFLAILKRSTHCKITIVYSTLAKEDYDMGLLDRDFDEKRNFIRMKVDTPVQVKVSTDEAETTGICHDLSGGGMLLSLDNELALNTELTVTVISKHGHNPMMKARCSVARIEPHSANTSMIGVEILEIINDDSQNDQ